MPPPEDPQRGLAGAYRHAWLGMQFAAAILLFMGVGYVLDRVLHSMPGFTLGGVLVGAVLGFLSIYRRVIGGDGGVSGDGRQGKK